MKKVNVNKKKRIFDDFFKIDEITYRIEKFNGEMSEPIRRLNFERGDSVAAIVYDTVKKKLLFTRQFRIAAWEKSDGWMLEIVAGMLDKEGTPEDIIKKEVMEEIGYATDSATPISTFFVSPGGTSERIHLFYVEVSEKVAEGGGLDSEQEDIQLVEYDVEDILQQLDNLQIEDAKTIIGLMWLKNKILENKLLARD